MKGLRLTEEQFSALKHGRAPKEAKPSKYGNVKVEIDGHKFDSKREGQYYTELKLREKANEIELLTLQVPFPVEINGKHICNYLADFVYWDVQTGEKFIIDVKGKKTDIYRLKKKMVEAYHGIIITEVK